jgi:hypothetical protein
LSSISDLWRASPLILAFRLEEADDRTPTGANNCDRRKATLEWLQVKQKIAPYARAKNVIDSYSGVIEIVVPRTSLSSYGSPGDYQYVSFAEPSWHTVYAACFLQKESSIRFWLTVGKPRQSASLLGQN